MDIAKGLSKFIFFTFLWRGLVMLAVAEKPLTGGKEMGMSAEKFVDQLQKDCLEHLAMKHSYLKKFADRKLNKGHIKLFAEQYYCFSRHFARYLAALVAITPDEAARAPRNRYISGSTRSNQAVAGDKALCR
jgi:hypothetical protein